VKQYKLTILKKALVCQGNIGAIRYCLTVVYFNILRQDDPQWIVNAQNSGHSLTTVRWRGLQSMDRLCT